SLQLPGYLGIDAHERLGHRVMREAEVGTRVPAQLNAASSGQIGVVVPHVLLGHQALHGPALDGEHLGDVEQDLWLEIALLWLMRLEQEDRRRAERLTRSVVPGSLGEYPGLQCHPGGGRVVRVVWVG